jgi:hypothetical protein
MGAHRQSRSGMSDQAIIPVFIYTTRTLHHYRLICRSPLSDTNTIVAYKLIS